MVGIGSKGVAPSEEEYIHEPALGEFMEAVRQKIDSVQKRAAVKVVDTLRVEKEYVDAQVQASEEELDKEHEKFVHELQTEIRGLEKKLDKEKLQIFILNKEKASQELQIATTKKELDLSKKVLTETRLEVKNWKVKSEVLEKDLAMSKSKQI